MYTDVLCSETKSIVCIIFFRLCFRNKPSQLFLERFCHFQDNLYHFHYFFPHFCCRWKANRFIGSNPYCDQCFSTSIWIPRTISWEAIDHWFWLWGSWPMSNWKALYHAGILCFHPYLIQIIEPFLLNIICSFVVLLGKKILHYCACGLYMRVNCCLRFCAFWQLAFPDAIYLVDAIQGGKTLINACKPALESSYITKVIHDCKRDSEVSNWFCFPLHHGMFGMSFLILLLLLTLCLFCRH